MLARHPDHDRIGDLGGTAADDDPGGTEQLDRILRLPIGRTHRAARRHGDLTADPHRVADGHRPLDEGQGEQDRHHPR